MAETRLLVIRILQHHALMDQRLLSVLEHSLCGMDCQYVDSDVDLSLLEGRRILFVLSLGPYGINRDYYGLLERFRREADCLEGCVAGLVVDGQSPLYTKSVARELVFTANRAGCTFVGRPLVEGTQSLENFTIVAQNMGTDYLDAYRNSVRLLAEQIIEFDCLPVPNPSLLVLHASSHQTSNTLALWNLVKERLQGIEIEEIGLRNGAVADCAGCPYQMCLHFGEKESCFYGGPMVQDVYPAVKRAQGLMLLCPNYNDALSANLTAFINRLTALFRTTRFYDKALFALVVSGYSGSDIVAQQLIAALNMNKTFYLPGHFAMLETANQAGSAVRLPDITKRMDGFASVISKTLTNT